MSTEGPNRGDRGFQAFLGVVLWIISGAVLLTLIALFVLYLV